MMKIALTAAAIAAIIPGACATSVPSDNYTVRIEQIADPSAMNGKKIYITNYDTGEPIDSIVGSADPTLTISGMINEPVIGRLVLGGQRGPIFLLEKGEINVDLTTGDATGTPLNDRLTAYSKKQTELTGEYNELVKSFQEQTLSDSLFNVKVGELQQKARDIDSEIIKANANNPLGLFLLLNNIYEIPSMAALNDMIAEYPVLSQSARLAKYRESLANVEATSVGKMYRNFTVDYNGKSQSLSDYVGKGHYTLVDFWASWCGPCIREIKVLKELYAKYADKGLDFLGVAVWDEPTNTESAIKQLAIPWPCIINAQSVPTDLYGISGIPCIILFAPDGKIVGRNLRGEELENLVAEVMATSAEETN